MARPLDDPPVRTPGLRRMVGELTTPVTALRLLPALPEQLRRRPGPRRHVLVLPGWLTGDASTVALRAALSRDGHDVRGWGLGQNTGDIPARIREVLELVRSRARATGGQLDLVGWSLGGAIAREVARRDPSVVRRIVTLGTPMHGSSFTAFASLFREDVQEITKERLERRRAVPPPVPITVIWSKRDGVVHWRAQQDRDNPWAEHVEVTSTHLGMGIDPDVLDTVRDRVADDVTTALRA